VKLTPLDIRKQEFKRTVRGFDIEEVETFLDMVAEHFETLLKERKELNDELMTLRTQLRDYQQVEKTLKETLVNAQQNISESRETSKREAELIVREAELKAEEILDNTKTKLLEMKNELLLLTAQKKSFVKRIKQLLQSQMELIDVLGTDDLELGSPATFVTTKISKSEPEKIEETLEIHEEPRIVGLDEEQHKKNEVNNNSSSVSDTNDSQHDENNENDQSGQNKKLSDDFII